MSNCGERGLRDTLQSNLGRVVNIFTDSGDEFTGVLSAVDTNSVKLIALDNHICGDAQRRQQVECGDYRRILTLPINKIDCLASSQY